MREPSKAKKEKIVVVEPTPLRIEILYPDDSVFWVQIAKEYKQGPYLATVFRILIEEAFKACANDEDYVDQSGFPLFSTLFVRVLKNRKHFRQLAQGFVEPVLVSTPSSSREDLRKDTPQRNLMDALDGWDE